MCAEVAMKRNIPRLHFTHTNKQINARTRSKNMFTKQRENCPLQRRATWMKIGELPTWIYLTESRIRVENRPFFTCVFLVTRYLLLNTRRENDVKNGVTRH